jgi:hypothetical protein
MSSLRFISKLFPSLFTFVLIAPSRSAFCPPDGPLLPRPSALHESSLIQNATQSLKSTFDEAVAGNLKLPWALPNVSFTIAVVSLDTPDTSAPLWEYHHLATGNLNGTKHADGDSQYLIGSISKVVTDLMLLKTRLSLDD